MDMLIDSVDSRGAYEMGWRDFKNASAKCIIFSSDEQEKNYHQGWLDSRYEAEEIRRDEK